MTDQIKLPEPDTSSMAYGGRSVDYINGYEAGYEAAADQVRAAVLEERERCAKRRLSSYVNAADICAADMPHTVLEKLQAAIDAAIREGK